MSEFGRPGESDWESEDLLTHDVAAVRLRKEIELEAAVVEAAGADSSGPAIERAQKRLASMRQHLARIDAALAATIGAGASHR